MAGLFVNPFPQFFNSTPSVYASGNLYFYASGTSTPLDTYSDEDLSTENANPVPLNSAGRPATQIFLQDADYKVVLEDSSGNTIWTADPVRARDSALVVATKTGSGSPSGAVAGTAASSGVLPTMYWDYTNEILYVCTLTGSTSTAEWTAINASAATAAYFAPQGRLTLASGTPVVASDQSAKTAVYYTPYVGNLVPIYNGTSMVPTTFSELTLTLASQHTASSIYDVFVFSNSGVLTLATGPAWTTATAGSGARGTGAGTTELSRVGGLWTNTVQITGRNGSNTYTIGANLATYLGSISMDGTNGQVTCHTSWGQSRKFGVWNAYNRVPIILRAGDSTASWTYSSATVRAANNSSSNVATTFCGLAEENIDIIYRQLIGNDASSFAKIGIGINATNAYTGATSQALANTSATNGPVPGPATHTIVPAIGIQNVYCCESNTAGAGSATYLGGNDDMVLTITYRG